MNMSHLFSCSWVYKEHSFARKVPLSKVEWQPSPISGGWPLNLSIQGCLLLFSVLRKNTDISVSLDLYRDTVVTSHKNTNTDHRRNFLYYLAPNIHIIYFLFELMSVVTWSILWRSASLILVLSIMLSEPLQLEHLKNNSIATSNFTRGQSRLPQW